MSRHYSKFALNTYAGTPYFCAHLPQDYPLQLVLQKCRAFRHLPSHLRELAGKAKAWAIRSYPDAGLKAWYSDWYDEDGNELEPGTGRKLTDDEIDAEWERWADPELDKLIVQDIPVPDGGFPDPDTWEPAAPKDGDADDDDRPTPEQLARDVRSHGAAYVAADYGVSVEQLLAMLPIQDREGRR